MATLRERVAQKKREAIDRATTAMPAVEDINSPCTEHELWAVRPLPGRGLGCIALTDLTLGTRVLAEPPLTVEGPGLPTIDRAVEALTAADRSRFFALAQEVRLYGQTKSIEGIVGTNGIPFEVDGEEYGGIFPRASRFNHSCDANTIYSYNAALGMLTVHAARNVSAGEELTFNYLPPFTDSLSPSINFRVGCHETLTEALPLGSAKTLRQQHLCAAFGFDCSCTKCSLTGEDLARSEERVRVIGDDASLAAAWAHRLASPRSAPSDDTEALLRHLETRYRLAKEEYPEGHHCGVDRMLRLHVELCDSAASLHHGAGKSQASLCSAFGQAAHNWARMARDTTLEIAGADSPAYMAWTKVLEQDCWRLSGPDLERPSFAFVWTAACKEGTPPQAWMIYAGSDGAGTHRSASTAND